MMNNSVRTFILFFASFLLSAQTWALSARELRQTVRNAYQICGSLNCQSLNLTLKEVPVPFTAQLPSSVTNSLTNLAYDLAQVWGDTILEGDFEADERVSLDRIQILTQNDEMIGFRLTYSAAAFDHAAKTSGRIQESGFVTSDRKKMFADPGAFAEFHPSQY